MEQDQTNNPTQAAQSSDLSAQHVVEVTTNLDDATPELVGHVIGKLLKLGALDAWAVPIVMKKSRPGWMLSLLAAEDERDALGMALLRETGSLGLRYRDYERMTLVRSMHHVHTPIGEVPVKVGAYASKPQEAVTAKPEHDALVVIAEKEGLPFKRVQQIANAAANNLLNSLNEGGSSDEGESESGGAT